MSEQEKGMERTENLLPASRQGYGLTICLDWNRMLIHRKTIRAIGHPQRVRLLINPDTRHFCVQGCDEKEACSFPVPRDMAPVYDPFYIHSKFLLSQIYSMMAWNPSLSYRVFGNLNTSIQVMDFDLSRYVQVHGDEHLENDEIPEEWMQDDQKLSFPAHQEEPEVESASVLPDIQTPEPAPEVPSSTVKGFMGGLFDNVRLPDRKGKNHV